MNVLLFNFNNVLTDVVEKLKENGHTILPLDGKPETLDKADVVVLWNETELGGWKDWVEEAKAKGKRTVLVQHGRRGTSRIYPPFNEKLVSDTVCVWGENDKKRLMECGVEEDRIVVTGTPVVKYVAPRIPHQGINVVFSPEHWGQEVVENLIVAGALRNVDGINVITKILEGEHNPREYDNPVTSNRNQPGHLDICIETLKRADVVVAISESTFELLAEIMDIPVIIADIWIPKSNGGDDRYKTYKREYSNACEKVKDVGLLGEVIKKYISNPHLKQRERREIGILDGGTNIKDPINEIIKVICAH